MLNTEESQSTFSLDALLGVQSEDEELPDEEARSGAEAGSSSAELLSMLGLASEEPPVAERPVEHAQEPASLVGGVDLRALLGLGDDGGGAFEAESRPAPAASVAPLALDALTGQGVEALPAESEPAADRAVERTEAESKKVVAPVRSRFADAPAFREPAPAATVPAPAAAASKAAPAAEPKAASVSASPAPKPAPAPVSAPASKAVTSPAPAPAPVPKPAPASPMTVTPAVQYLAGDLRPLALPERVQASGKRAASEARVAASHPAKPSKPEVPTPVASPAARPEPVKPPVAKPVPATTAAPGRPAPAPVAASKPPTAAKPIRPSVDAAARPASTERKVQPAKRGNGVWYLLSAALFAIALACTCYAVYASAQSAAEKPAALLSAGAEDAAGEQRFRYAVEGPDGTTRAVEETARFDVDGLVAESVISLAGDTDAEAAQMLDDARSQFGDAFVSGAVKDGAAVFTVRHGEEGLDREAYAALLRSSTIDCETVE